MGAVGFSIHASHCCGERAFGPSAPPGAGTWGTGSPECAGHRHPAPHGGTRRCRPTIPYGLPIWFVGRDRGTGSPEYVGHRHPAPHGGTRRCRPTIPYGLPIWFVGRDLCVPPPIRTAPNISPKNIYRGWYPKLDTIPCFPLKEGRVPQSVKSS